MNNEDAQIILAGHGGQGVISMTEILGTAITAAGRYSVCHMVYGAEMRGGIVRCYVTISDEEPTATLIENPDGVVCMNEEAWEHFHDAARAGGFAVVNSSLVKDPEQPANDVRLYPVPCNELAEEAGSAKTVSMVGLGALLELTHVTDMDQIEAALADVLPERHHKLIPVNVAALEAGMAAVRERSPAATG